MAFTGEFSSIGKDLTTGKYIVSILVNEDVRAVYEKLNGINISIDIKKYRKRRSLNANSFLWVILQKMAVKLGTSKDELYIEMLDRYGVYTHIVVKPNMVDKVKNEWRTVRVLGNVTVGKEIGTQLQCYFGSSTYDTKEMSKLIDGIVSECEDLEIETLPPNQLERMKREWGVDIEQKD